MCFLVYLIFPIEMKVKMNFLYLSYNKLKHSWLVSNVCVTCLDYVSLP
jgi:hypothetical protein